MVLQKWVCLFKIMTCFTNFKYKQPPAGVEPATLGLEVPRAIQLRHGGCLYFYKTSSNKFLKNSGADEIFFK